jgi:tRNA1Val (adenine37-N6)-methyltransferase
MAHNNWFQFKQFKVWQNHAAMRVGTDGVLLGVWCQVENCNLILDIGTGTGLIALMLAQRSDAKIDAIDLDHGAIIDAQQNFMQSPWSNRLMANEISLQDFTKVAIKTYDLIVCNPPYFNNAVKAKQKNRALARHTDALSFDDLIKNVAQLLTENGRFSVVLPAETEQNFRSIAANYKLFTTRITRIKPKPSKPIVRVLMEFQFDALTTSVSELTLETDTHHEYTSEFREMVKDFYLNIV